MGPATLIGDGLTPTGPPGAREVQDRAPSIAFDRSRAGRGRREANHISFYAPVTKIKKEMNILQFGSHTTRTNNRRARASRRSLTRWCELLVLQDFRPRPQ